MRRQYFGIDSGFVPAPPPDLVEPGGIAVREPGRYVLLLYLHGSEAEHQLDVWAPHAEEGTTPPVLKALAGGKIGSGTVLVYAHVTNVMPLGHTLSSIAFTPERMKLPRRCAEVVEVLNDFERAGYRRSRMFLAGHSAGGWIALRLVAQDPKICAGGIAFAPAMAGQRNGRLQWWSERRSEQAAQLSAAASLPALVYAIKGDEWEQPPHLDFLKAIPGLEYREAAPGRGRLTPHSPWLFHCGAFSPKFASETPVIRSFLERRVATPDD